MIRHYGLPYFDVRSTNSSSDHSRSVMFATMAAHRLAAFQHTHDCPDTDAQSGGDLANARPVFLVECAADCFLGLLVDPGSAKLSSFRFGPCETGADPLLDHRALELSKNAQHLEHRRSGRRGSVDALLVEAGSIPSAWISDSSPTAVKPRVREAVACLYPIGRYISCLRPQTKTIHH